MFPSQISQSYFFSSENANLGYYWWDLEVTLFWSSATLITKSWAWLSYLSAFQIQVMQVYLYDSREIL